MIFSNQEVLDLISLIQSHSKTLKGLFLNLIIDDKVTNRHEFLIKLSKFKNSNFKIMKKNLQKDTCITEILLKYSRL